MRLPFLSFGKKRQAEPVEASAPAARVEVRQRPVTDPAPAPESRMIGDIDLRAIGRAIVRRRRWILGPTAAVFLLSALGVNLVTPRYKSEARILVDGRENVFLRANAERSEERGNTADPEAVTSQVQLVLSRDLARDIIKKNKLDERPEFDVLLQGINPLTSLAALFGIVRDPAQMSKEERVLDAYYDRLAAFAVDKSRVIAVEFQSRDPDLAARVANSIAEGYLTLQQAAKQEQARSAGQWLSGEIESLRAKVAESDSKVEDFRSKSGLFVGTNNTTLSNQQMGEVNTQLGNARALKSDAESKSKMIRQMIQGGQAIEASDVLNSELVRRLSEQRVTLRAQLAEQSSTLLASHPRIKELKAQIGDLDTQIREEAGKIARSLENDARIAGARVDSQTASLEQMKKQATSSNTQDVQLRALERESKAQRDLLESYLTKYREASARENLDAAPADARIISRGTVSNIPAYPKKMPIVLIATLATLLLSTGVVVSGELLRMTAESAAAMPRPESRIERTAPAFAYPEYQQQAAPQPPFAQPFQQQSFEQQPFQQPAAPRVGLSPAIAQALAATRSQMPPQQMPPMQAYPPATPQMAAPQPQFVPQPVPSADLKEIAAMLKSSAARKITVTSTSAATSAIAMQLARMLAASERVVLVDLSISPVQHDISGVADLVRGTVSFGDVISRDRSTTLQIVSGGRGPDRAMLGAPRLAMALDALMQVYDHVVIDAGVLPDAPEPILTQAAHVLLLSDNDLDAMTQGAIADQLIGAGFMAATVIGPATAGGSGSRQFAA